MRPLLLLLLFMMGLSACRKDTVDYDLRTSYFRNINAGRIYDTALTVMTYNIQCGFPSGLDPWNVYDTGGTAAHIDSLAGLIEASGADIVALQEVPLDRSNNIVKKFLDSLAHKSGMNYAFTSHGYNDAYAGGAPATGQWGVAILSRYTIEEIDSREVSFRNIWDRRSTLRARLRLNASKEIDVYSLHHAPMQDYSDIQKTSDFVHESLLPKIVCGDFNTGPQVPHQYLNMNESLPDSLRGIDMIFRTSEFTVTEAHTSYTRLSDHLPYWVRLHY